MRTGWPAWWTRVLRAVAHAAGISPTMADWRRILTVDLVGTAMLAEALRPLATTGTAMVCFAWMAPLLGNIEPDPSVAGILDAPLDERFLDRIHDALGADIEDPGMAFLLSAEASFLAGIDVLIDGGVFAAVRSEGKIPSGAR